jgi:YggT family protein
MTSSPLLHLLDALRSLLYLLIMARMIVSFLPNIDMNNPIIKFVFGATEPMLAPFRAILPSTRIGIDFSPLLLMLVVDMVFRLLANII